MAKKKKTEPFDGEVAVSIDDLASAEKTKQPSRLAALGGKAKGFKDFAVSRITGRAATDPNADAREKPLAPGSAEAFIDLKSIREGIIETVSGKYVKIVEVNPILFSLLSEPEKEDVVSQYASWLRVAPVSVQIKTISRRADPTKHINEVKHDLASEQSEKVRQMGEEYIEFVQNTSRGVAKTRRWFVIFRYNGTETDFWEIKRDLEQAADMLKAVLDGCGNMFPVDDNPYLTTLHTLYLLLNKKSYLNETAEERYAHIRDDLIAESRRDDPFTPIPIVSPARIVAPHGLNFTRPDYYIQDGLYCGTFFVRPDSIPGRVYSGWTSWLYNLSEDIDIDIYLKKVDNIADRVGSRVRNNKAKASDTADTRTDFYDLNDSINAGYHIIEALANGQQFFWLSIFVTVSATTEREYYILKKQLSEVFRARQLELSFCRFSQIEAFRSTLPYATISPALEARSRRNILTYGAASMYPFNQFELSSDRGVFLGLNALNGSLCVVDPFDTSKLPNANITILAPSGSGKTFLTMLLCLRLRMRKIKPIIIAPIKGVEYARSCKAIGGQYIRISRSSRDRINIMEIRNTVSPDMALLDGIEEESLLAHKVQQVLAFLELHVDKLTVEEEHAAEEAIIQTYLERGITYDNGSIFVNGKDGEIKEMPIISDLYAQICKHPALSRLQDLLTRYVTGSVQNWNGQTNVDLSSDYIVLDVSSVDGTLLPIAMMIVSDYVWDMVKKDRTERQMVVFDEVWKMIGTNADSRVAQFVLEVVKTIRGYGGGVITATQGLSDFRALNNGMYGREIINNSATKFILSISDSELEETAAMFRLTSAEARSVTQSRRKDRRGEALLMLGSTHVPIRVQASELEHNLITTDAAELKELIRSIKAAESAGAGLESKEEESYA